MDDGSKPYAIVWADLKKIGTGAFIAMVGAIIAYLSTDVIPVFSADPTDIQKYTIAAVAGVLVNVLRKYVTDTTPKPPDPPAPA